MQEQHEMILEETYPSGSEEWFCPLCERRLLLMNWHPAGQRIIIKLGDESSHSDHELDGLPHTETSNLYKLGVDDEARLAAWDSWLDEVGFESWWND